MNLFYFWGYEECPSYHHVFFWFSKANIEVGTGIDIINQLIETITQSERTEKTHG